MRNAITISTMDKIIVTFPKHIPHSTIVFILERGLSTHSEFTCKIKFLYLEDDENVFQIRSKDGAKAFYLIGIVSAGILAAFDK